MQFLADKLDLIYPRADSFINKITALVDLPRDKRLKAQ